MYFNYPLCYKIYVSPDKHKYPVVDAWIYLGPVNFYEVGSPDGVSILLNNDIGYK